MSDTDNQQFIKANGDEQEEEFLQDDFNISHDGKEENLAGLSSINTVSPARPALREGRDKPVNSVMPAKLVNIIDEMNDNIKKDQAKALEKEAYNESALEIESKKMEEDNETDQEKIPEEEEIDESSKIKLASQEKAEDLQDKIKEIDQKRREEEIKESAMSQGFGYINLKGLPIVPEALRVIAETEAKERGIICFIFKKGREMRLAVLDYRRSSDLIEQLIAGQETEAKIYLTSEKSLNEAIKLYKSLPKILEETDDVKILEADLEKTMEQVTNLKEWAKQISKISTTEIFSMVLAAAIKMEASDIHIEAEETGIGLRYRIDGVLHNVARLERGIWDKLISRIKLSSRLKINIKDKPQDGRFSVHIGAREIDFRISTLPTAYGESVVMRILFHERVKTMTLDKLGIDNYNREILEKEINRPNGMLVVTGPTGSGKTTTLYAVLNKLNTKENKIITIEDPIEYKIEGINQSEINSSRGYDFATALRSVVRQDPDIILVGEIRDKETTEIALNAALTGHLLFATFHTNDAAGAIPRFLALGAKPYLLSPALNVAVAQRLVRKICEHCREEQTINEQEKELIRTAMEALPEKYKEKHSVDFQQTKFFKGRGCEKCGGLGYKGQIGIFEILEVNDEIRNIILSEMISETRIKEIAVKNGMITLRQDGILKVIRGATSLEEVMRVT